MPKDTSDGYERLTDIAAEVKKEGSTVSHVIQEVIQNYTELKNVFHDFYKENFKNMPQHVDRIANELARAAQNAKEDAMHFVDMMSDMSPPVISTGPHVSKLFANVSVLLFIAFVSSFIGSYIFAPLFGVIFLKFGALLIAAVFIPLIARYFYFNLKVRHLSENKKRIVCATFIFEQSLLIGFINQSDWLDTPFTISTQIIASFVFPMMLAHTVQRDKILAAVFSSCMLFHIIHGILTLGLTAGFLLVAILYTLLAVGLIQYVIAYRTHPDLENMHVAMQYVFAVSLVKMFSLMAFGGQE